MEMNLPLFSQGVPGSMQLGLGFVVLINSTEWSMKVAWNRNKNVGMTYWKTISVIWMSKKRGTQCSVMHAKKFRESVASVELMPL